MQPTPVFNAGSCGVGSVVLTASAGTIGMLLQLEEFRKQFYNSCIICNNSLLGETSNSCTTSARVQVIATISTGVVEVNANSGTVFGCYSTVKKL
jgi:hypothetical protein